MLHQQNDVDSQPIGCFGFSSGATIEYSGGDERSIGCWEQVARVNETPAQDREFTEEEKEEGEKGEARQGNHYC